MQSSSDFVADAQAALRKTLRSLNKEISGYPTPISGCDAQFNYLLAQRGQLNNALIALTDDVFVPTPRIPNEGDRVESR